MKTIDPARVGFILPMVTALCLTAAPARAQWVVDASEGDVDFSVWTVGSPLGGPAPFFSPATGVLISPGQG